MIAFNLIFLEPQDTFRIRSNGQPLGGLAGNVIATGEIFRRGGKKFY